MLIVKNLTLSLNGEPLLRNVDFSVAPGEILTLMGPSGSGKSTLFAWMVGALAENFRAAGELWLDNQRCDSLPTERRRIGILFQDALLFDHFSVGQNLLLALAADVRGPQRKAQVEQALERAMAGIAGAEDFQKSFAQLREHLATTDEFCRRLSKPRVITLHEEVVS